MMRRRGGILFETLIALAIFIGAAGLALRASNQALGRVDVRARTQQALDFGLAKLAELDAGLISLTDLRGDDIDGIGSMEFADAGDMEPPPWEIDIRTQRTTFGELSLVQLTIREREPDAGWGEDQRPIEVAVRELITLREGDVDLYEVDELLDDLPLDAPPDDAMDDRSTTSDQNADADAETSTEESAERRGRTGAPR
ncbi:MAG: hypothetical protein KC983_02230 [Phycisphaerales bacterium]|nr:hypothetical protein [Phycisphaerales bacterium]